VINLFHKHRWIKIKETYAEPVPLDEISGVSSEELHGLTSGVTTILWECEICQKIRREEMLGKEIPPLMKVQRIGPRMTATEILERKKEEGGD
jgi:hypothetical protein